jgi:phosphatidate cytidylyltransferase
MEITPELRKRIVTGAVGGVALLGLIVFGGWLGIFFLTTVLSIGMMFEFTDITFVMSDRIEKRYVLLSMTWFVALVNLLAPQTEFALLIVSFLTLFVYFLLSARRHGEALFAAHFKELMFSVFALIYLVFIPLFLTRIYESPNGLEWTVLFLLIVWAGDTGAYFAGKRFGQRKLYPEISPKKTIEGSLGGLASGLAVALIYKLLIFRGMSWWATLCLPIVVGAVAQVGDLCESFFKRAFEKKDSGWILPGHGGFLDRFDGVVFSLPVMYACIRIFG